MAVDSKGIRKIGILSDEKGKGAGNRPGARRRDDDDRSWPQSLQDIPQGQYGTATRAGGMSGVKKFLLRYGKFHLSRPIHVTAPGSGIVCGLINNSSNVFIRHILSSQSGNELVNRQAGFIPLKDRLDLLRKDPPASRREIAIDHSHLLCVSKSLTDLFSGKGPEQPDPQDPHLSIPLPCYRSATTRHVPAIVPAVTRIRSASSQR